MIRKWNNGWSTFKLRKEFGISERRINQILVYYKETGEIPVVGTCMGRPVKFIAK